MQGSPREKSYTGRGLSLTQKLVALILLTTGAAVAFLTVYFPEQQIAAARADLERRASMYGTLVSKQVASAIAFDDRETAREVFDAVGHDRDVASLTLLKADGSVLYARGRAGVWIDAARRGVRASKIVEVGDMLAVVAPVQSLEGPWGTLVIELSTAQLEAEKARIQRTALGAGGATLALGAVFAFLIARSIGRRVGTIARAASAAAAGQLDQPPPDVGGGDEVTALGAAFTTMLQQIRGLLDQIRTSAQEEQARLERLVRERTGELDARNAAMKLVLDNVEQGFLTADLDGALGRERSRALDEWFGAPGDDDSIASFFGRVFPGSEGAFRIGWDALREEWMPLELRLDQLPRQLSREGRHFAFGYKPIGTGEELNSLLVVVTDQTAVVEQRLAEEAERELLQSVRWLLRDRSGFEAFLSEADDLVKAVEGETDRRVRARVIHTLKGNAALFGFASITRVCHEVEETMVDTQEDASPGERARITGAWSRLRERITPFVQGRSAERMEVSRSDYERALDHIKARVRHSHISTLLHTWDLEPTEGRLRRLADYAEGLAERLGKGPISVRVAANDVRLDPAEWAGFWQTIVHVVRNAVDHGLETHEERAAQQKSDEGALVLSTRVDQGTLTVTIRDNGRGVDWSAVRAAARRVGVAADNEQDLEHALFADALSTASEASTTSGRGVGLSAVRQYCDETGGQITLSSTPHEGTTFTFSWPIDELGRRVTGASVPSVGAAQ
jgi:two-component system, chemotaxis family, sensor kinase CheA